MLIVVLTAGIYGVIPARASAEILTEPISPSQSSLVSQREDCSPGSGWMWTDGPFRADITIQAQQELSRRGIDSSVEARSYGETDSCGTYHHHGIDFTITLADTESTSPSSQQGLADDILPVLAIFGKPDLGNVKLVSAQGELIPISRPDRLSTTQAMEVETLTVDTITKKVYVIVYDPLLDNGQKLSEFMLWNDHASITQQTIE